MTTNERSSVGVMWLRIAQVFGKSIEPQTMKVMLDAVDDLPADEVASVLASWMKTTRLARYPFPSEIRERLGHSEAPEDIGRDVASRIIESVSRFGWNNSESAKEFIGELGWVVVTRQGGWVTVCQELDENNKGVMQAQMRDLAITVYRRAQTGKLDQAPALPVSTKAAHLKLQNPNSELRSFSGLLNEIKEKAGNS